MSGERLAWGFYINPAVSAERCAQRVLGANFGGLEARRLLEAFLSKRPCRRSLLYRCFAYFHDETSGEG